MDREEGSCDGGVGAEEGDGGWRGVGEEFARGGCEEEGWQGGGLICVEEGGEAFGEEEGGCWMGHCA